MKLRTLFAILCVVLAACAPAQAGQPTATEVSASDPLSTTEPPTTALPTVTTPDAEPLMFDSIDRDSRRTFTFYNGYIQAFGPEPIGDMAECPANSGQFKEVFLKTEIDLNSQFVGSVKLEAGAAVLEATGIEPVSVEKSEGFFFFITSPSGDELNLIVTNCGEYLVTSHGAMEETQFVSLLTPYNTAYSSDGSGVFFCDEGIQVSKEIVLQFADGTDLYLIRSQEGFLWSHDRVDFYPQDANDTMHFQGMGEITDITPISEAYVCYGPGGIGVEVSESRVQPVDLEGIYLEALVTDGNLDCSANQATDVSIFFLTDIPDTTSTSESQDGQVTVTTITTAEYTTIIYIYYSSNAESFVYKVFDETAGGTLILEGNIPVGKKLVLAGQGPGLGNDGRYEIQSCGTGLVTR